MSFNRKRRFNQSDDYGYDQNYRNNQGYNGNDGYHSYPYKRGRRELPTGIILAKTLCRDIFTMGDNLVKFTEDLEFMCKPILQNFESDQLFRDSLLDCLYAVTTEQPHKVLHLAGFIQAVNSGSHKIGSLLVEFFHQKLQDLIQKGTNEPASESPESNIGVWDTIKLVLRLLSSLSFIIDHDDLIKIHKQFLNLAIELQSNKDQRSPLGEAIYYNTLISVPYLLVYCAEETKAELKSKIFAELISLAERFNVKSSAAFTITHPYLETTQAAYESKNIAELILPALKADLENDVSYFIDFYEVVLPFLTLKEGKHHIPQLSMPTAEELSKVSLLQNAKGNVDSMWKTARFTFQVYLPQEKFSTTPSPESYFGLLLRDIQVDVIEAIEFNRTEVALQLVNMQSFFKENTFTFEGRSIESLETYINEKAEDEEALSTWKLEDTLFESILSLMYNLPDPSKPLIYYFTTIVDFFNNSMKENAKVGGRAIRFFYSHAHVLDFELRMRYVDWLSVQFSNFGFGWKWIEWESDGISQMNNIHHPRLFVIKSIIAKCLCLTETSVIEGTLPPTFQAFLDISLFTKEQLAVFYKELLDGKISEEEGSSFSFSKESSPFADLVKRWFDYYFAEENQEDIDVIIGDIKQRSSEFSQPSKVLIYVLMQTISMLGDRSFSHVNKVIDASERFLLSAIRGDSESPYTAEVVQTNERYLIDALLKSWNSQPKTAFIVLNYLESRGIISSSSKLLECVNGQYGAEKWTSNCFSVESVYSTLDQLTAGEPEKKECVELNEVLRVVIDDISAISEKLSDSEVAELPDIYEYELENVDKQWRYQSLIGFLRSALRKYSKFVNVEQFKEIVEAKIQKKSTADLIKSWIGQLDQL
ncbi:hypothetical protein WICPIJ_000468 [Wickerhamomyces pijperi]|uniref:MIF4G domain-containing protein n=1 Tax=Wickerhamomyces pijperi TaxID=599730 RepID=A0A9P8QCJ8_WICPI|nr:hypothetical protein WICPIJ_000468 [Wickerhamomyces pijperi]